MKIIAHIKTDFPTKFGLPRQSGLIDNIEGKIVFEKEYQNIEALRGLEDFSHIWLLWKFSETERDSWSPTVRPPMLGGNKRMGVFATRSPFRPNPIGLSAVKLERIEFTKNEGPVLFVRGADLMDNTPIYDIKPYLPFADSIENASGGFAEKTDDRTLSVSFPEELRAKIPHNKIETLCSVLASDPRPSYQNDPERVYGFEFAEFEISFKVNEKNLTVCDVKIK
ncbi:MAG: tRNA (N6-threonylcarbamoyladenosine(37)-N6)-methyltransferase TrmO [Oscillospiraceae bacterium]|nr:tRNA (N6-threonylcarbamoyladenosine(37)-N6)-methyltransferase TrmO [Oscillospiraceae bacterium]